MTVVKSQSFHGGQNGLTILAKIFFSRVLKIYLIICSDHFGQYFFGKVLDFFVVTMVNGACRPLMIEA